MIAAERRLAALGACLAGARAPALLARGPGPEARAVASRLAGLPREERLRALAAAIHDASSADLAGRASVLARRERPRVAALVSALSRGDTPGPEIASALVRVIVERLSR